MIYQICGFNLICDHYFEKLSDYVFDKTHDLFPVVHVSIAEKLTFDIPDKVEMTNHLGYSAHSKCQSYYRFMDGSSIFFSPSEVVFCGECFDNERIGNEISSADIVIISRYHKRAVLHGSAFMYQGKAYLICAVSGAGKSTLSSALVKFHSGVSFLTDDIICIREDGQAMYSGLRTVSLNEDSLRGIFKCTSNLHDNPAIGNSTRTKTSLTLFSEDKYENNQVVEIGGVFFLQEATHDNLIEIEELDHLSFFCEAMKNIKHKPAMINDLLLQEMTILNNLVSSTHAVKIRIKHDYSSLCEIANRVIEYIDKRKQYGITKRTAIEY